MKNYDNDRTVKQEMERLGVNYGHFEIFYDGMKESGKAPSKDDLDEVLSKKLERISDKQYSNIIHYLLENNVIENDKKVIEKGLKSLDDRLEQEYRQRASQVIKDFKELGNRRLPWQMKD